MSLQVEIHELIDKDLKGATVIDGFPGVGLVGTITANHLINSQGLEQIGVIESPHFPAVSVVKDGVPHNPVRLYAGEQACLPDLVKRDGKWLFTHIKIDGKFFATHADGWADQTG